VVVITSSNEKTARMRVDSKGHPNFYGKFRCLFFCWAKKKYLTLREILRDT